jgi:anaerobic magnesium-protoporphyrin IX monomethyl ester cyclase
LTLGPVLLIFPPGWSLDVGGPYLALPLLRSFLEKRGVPVESLDLNLGLASTSGVTLSEADVKASCSTPTLNSLNEPFFERQKSLASLAGIGVWDIREGFRAEGLNTASSEVVRCFVEETAPFAFLFSKHALPRVREINPSIIGISITVPGQLVPSLELCRLLRSNGYRGLIVLGGNLVTRLGKDICKKWIFDLVDGIALFQGEYAIYDLWTMLGHRGSMKGVRNMIWRQGCVIVSNAAEVLAKEDFLGPDFEGLEPSQYWGTSYLPMIASRGCYYGRCTFCAIPYAWGKGGFLGSAEPAAVVNHMAALAERWQIRRFKFVDEALHPGLLAEMSHRILEASLSFEFEGYARLERAWLMPRLIENLAKAGLKKLYFGLELTASENRARLGKNDASTHTLEILRLLNDYGIKSHLFCMVGFPGTGVKEAFDTLDFVLEHKNLIDTLDLFPFEYARHTRVDGIEVVQDKEDDWAINYAYRGQMPGVLSTDEVKILANEMEELLWRERPIWLHPIYRLYSPWW